MTKIKGKKTKLSGIMETTSWQATMIDTEMSIDKQDEKNLIAMMQGSQFFRLNPKRPTEWILEVPDGKEKKFMAKYEISHNGNKKLTLAASCNATTIVAGANDLPIIISGLRNIKGNKGVDSYLTFQYCNRMPYAILESIPSTNPFSWSADAKNRYKNGAIEIKQMQFAWYSKDLKSSTVRLDILNHVRACYGGTRGTNGRSKNLTEGLGIKTTIWDNSEGNLTLEARYGDRSDFSLTLYMKDKHPDYKQGTNEERLKHLIRFDCTFRPAFLETNKIKTVSDLEARYKELCEDGGYDIGFVRWLSKSVISRLKLDYVANLTGQYYLDCLNKLDLVEGKNEKMMIDLWRQGIEIKSSTVAEMGVKTKHYRRYVTNIFNETGLDIEVTKGYHAGALLNRQNVQMTDDEVEAAVLPKKSNMLVDLDELRRRDEINRQKTKNAFLGEDLTGDILVTRRLDPKKVHHNKLYIFQKIREHLENENEN